MKKDLMYFAIRREPVGRLRGADGRERTLVLGCWVDGVAYEFPHLHPAEDCAVCAYLARRATQDR
jgi:hypothetical protein